MKFDIESNIRAVHVIKDSQLVFAYQREDVSDAQLFPAACIFKSFLSVLTGIAIYEGKMESLEDCVLNYFPHDEIRDANWYRLKIKHALSKTTGLVWPGPGQPIPGNMGEVMKLPFENEPGAAFQYKPDPQIVVYLLEEVYQMEITELLRLKVAAHFQHADYLWDRAKIEEMQVSVQMLDELGQLMLNRGVIHGTRLFSEEYYEQSICKYSDGGFPECAPYGLSWWLNECPDTPCFYAAGFGGQYLAVIPQKNVTISIMSDMDRPHPENKKIIEQVRACL